MKSKLQSLSNERNLSLTCNLINSNLSLLQSAPVQSPAKTFPSKSCFNTISAAELHSNETNRAAQAHAACPPCCGMSSCMVMGHSKFLTGGSRNQWVAIIPHRTASSSASLGALMKWSHNKMEGFRDFRLIESASTGKGKSFTSSKRIRLSNWFSFCCWINRLADGQEMSPASSESMSPSSPAKFDPTTYSLYESSRDILIPKQLLELHIGSWIADDWLFFPFER